MAIIELQISKSKYKIECPPEQQDKLMHLAQKLNQRIKKLPQNLQIGDDKMLLAILLLMLEDELEASHKHSAGGKQFQENDDYNKFDEAYNNACESMENITSYIEKLAKKIENY